jgi:hypothetical protein
MVLTSVLSCCFAPDARKLRGVLRPNDVAGLKYGNEFLPLDVDVS